MTTDPDTLAILAGGSKDNMAADDGGLSLPTAELMALGGDARITLDEQSGLNSYGCAPKPMPAISYASSTASTVSAGAFAQARAFHFQLQRDARTRPVADIYADAMEDARQRLRLLYGIDESVDIAFGPSGTDLEYLVLATSLCAGKIVRNIVVEVDEVGSGCLNAQKGRYFAPRTALGLDVTTGDPVPGFPEERMVIDTISLRNPDGSLRDVAERERVLAEVIERSVAAGEQVLLHVVHRSKTGLIAPCIDILEDLVGRYGDRLDVIVDACQGRISPKMIQAYLALGSTVFVTGSKFLGGPPFSAFAFLPKQLGDRMVDCGTAAEGLGAFFARGEMPARWTAMDAVLPQVTNFGLLLRLECGLFELSRLLAYGEDVVARAVQTFHQAVRELPADSALRLLPASDVGSEEGLHPLDRTMLHTFVLNVRNPETGGELDIEDARAIYAMLYTDMSEHFSAPWDRMIASETCHVGQPVRCLRHSNGSWAPTLRLSLSAPHISEVAGLTPDALLRRFRTDLEWIAAKIQLVLPLLEERRKAA
nr:hypothetical protein [uncultured Sphingosinicella sp.]